MKKLLPLFLLFLCLQNMSLAQQPFFLNGLADNRPTYIAFTHAKVATEPGKWIEDATLVVNKGKIVSVTKSGTVPAGAKEIDLKGKWVYASFIDLYSSLGLQDEKPQPGFNFNPQVESRKAGNYSWNQAIKPELRAADQLKPEQKDLEELRALGFGAVLSTPKDGIMRGNGALLALGGSEPKQYLLRADVAKGLSFSKGNSGQDYPSSQMGSIALIRQTFYDASWYAANKEKNELNLSLESINQYKSLPWLFEAREKYEIFRAAKIAKEFNFKVIVKGKGDEYQRADALKQLNIPVVLPLNFPDAYDVENPFEAAQVGFVEMKHWELAPFNARILAEKQIPFAFTLSDLKDRKSFLAQVKKAIEKGLKEEQALAALTTQPATFINAGNLLGKIQPGFLANFIITSGNLFGSETQLFENWVMGERYQLADMDLTDIRGKYTFTVGTQGPFSMEIAGKQYSPEATIVLKDTTKTPIKLSFAKDKLQFQLRVKAIDTTADVRFSGFVSGKNLEGRAQQANGTWVNWRAEYTGTIAEKPKKDSTLTTPALPEIVYPFQAFGLPQQSKQNNYLIKGAMVHDNITESAEEKDVLIINGKVQQVGKSLTGTANVVTIDAKGKYLTPGIIDEHSHIAIAKGVNEGSHSISAEVRIGDVIDPDNVNIYRHLSAGVTACQLLHGSANAIGGQSALVKMRWGAMPEEMKIEGADGFIKFALGENVKQSNWGDFNKTRYPQTRMGVEQLYLEAFTAAKTYDQEWKNFQSAEANKGTTTTAPRRNLRLESIAEIVNKKRFISCHSYVQSEINMLMKVADKFGFKVNTFTHILEGYKVADKMAAHGVGGSTFADWWAYKMEVKDAIPYNAALMTKVGVTTAINSDDAEMARRLNMEAAKTMKYGGMSEAQALKMITLNPAMLLHLDKKMGTITPGKDADLVLWTDKPLSNYASVAQTWVDGVSMFSLEDDEVRKAYLAKEKARLVQAMLKTKQKGGPMQKPEGRKPRIYHCEDLGEHEL